MIQRVLSCSLLTLLGACAASARLPRLEVGAAVPVRYEASLAGSGLEARHVPGEDEAEIEARVGVDIRLLALPNGRDAEAWAELGDGPGGWIVAPAARLQILAAGELSSAPQLVLGEGLSGRCALLQQRAYVADYELSGDGRSLVADPVVEVLTHGSRFEVLARRAADGTLELELRWELCDGSAPFVEVERAFAPQTSVRIQVPVVLTSVLSAQAPLGPDESLLLAAPRSEGPRQVVLVRARLLVPGG